MNVEADIKGDFRPAHSFVIVLWTVENGDFLKRGRHMPSVPVQIGASITFNTCAIPGPSRFHRFGAF